MVKIHLFTMVKDEVDIVEDWIKYHGKMFGFGNIFVIDNYSTDGTYEILEKYNKEKGMHLIREKNYKEKGAYMRHLLKDNHVGRECDIGYPLDIDEFICYYNKKDNILVPNETKNYIVDIFRRNQRSELFKTNYIVSMVSSNDDIGHENGVKDIKYGILDDNMKNYKKGSLKERKILK